MATLVVFACRFVLGGVLSLGLLAVGPVLLGMTSTVVMSDSMAPGIRAGDVAIVRVLPASRAEIGQVVLVDDPNAPGRLRLHRLVGHEGARLVLKGDANAQRDPAAIAPSAVHGVAFLRVPWIGLPILWLRTGRPVPAALVVAALVGAAAVVAVLDPGGGPGGGMLHRLLRRSPLGRSGRRAVRVTTGGTVLVLAVLVVAAAATPPASTAWAAFSGTTASRVNSLGVPVWPCPTLPNPSGAGSPGIAWSFNPTSGTEPNRGVNGTAFNAATGSGDTRVTGGCSPASTPSLRFPGTTTQALVSASSVPASYPGTQTLWFNPTATTGVLESVGSGTLANTDRQLYFTSSGQLGFAMRNGSAGIMTCAAPGAITTGAWHFAAAVYDTTAKSVTLYLDGVQTACPTLITTQANITAPTRIGADVMLDTSAPTTPYSGSIDEVYAWGTPLNASQVAAVYANGH